MLGYFKIYTNKYYYDFVNTKKKFNLILPDKIVL